MPRDLPVIDNVTLEELYANPYPTYARLRKEAPVAWIKAANIALVTRFDDIIAIERDEAGFPARDMRSLQIKAMGHSLMRKDGEDHERERATLKQTFSPVTVKRHWGPIFDAIADDLIAELAPRGSADLYSEFASPMASRALAAIIGLSNVRWEDLVWWSQALIDATGNYGDDPAIWARNDRAVAMLEAAIDERMEALKGTDDLSVISGMVNAAEPLTRQQIHSNVKVVVGGGLNEPRDAICTTTLGLLLEPAQRDAAMADPALYARAFEEAVRWVAPIGMYPRKSGRENVLSGIVLPPDLPLGLSAASACHDDSHFVDGHRFDIFRQKAPHLAFGSGPHFCLGTWSARKMVGDVAVPRLFARLRNLRLDPAHPHRMGGWVFRGPLSLPVVWDA